MKRYVIRLSPDERNRLTALVCKGKVAAKKRLHAQVLLMADGGAAGAGWTDRQIVEALGISERAVQAIRQRCVEEGLEAALERRQPRRQYRRKLDGDGEAHLIALACGQAPDGRSRWTLRLLADRMVALEEVDHLSHETVRQVLKKTNLSLG